LNFCLSSIHRRSAIAAVAAARLRQYFAENSDIAEPVAHLPAVPLDINFCKA
jgi:hypothetical protein